ncbi:flippase-like domain-containing protein, partial [Candidatus Marinimicrobia bacterium]|nr:flippase-like domain-containing protein [Candidatus Neomarinimicrobiota bacterium]
KFKNSSFQIIDDIISGFSTINKSNFLLSIFYTILIWLSYIIVVYLVQKSMYLNLSFIQCILLLFLSSLVLMIPSMPGNIGTFEGSVVYTLLLFGIKDDFGFAFILHAVSFIPYTILGLFYLIKERYIFKHE